MRITSLYYYYYCYLRRFFKNGPSNWLYESKAIITLCFLEAIVLVGLIFYILVVLDVEIRFKFHPAFVVIPLSFLLYAVNHWALLYKRRWKFYDETLEKASRKARNMGRVLAILTTIGSPTIFILILLQIGKMKGTW